MNLDNDETAAIYAAVNGMTKGQILRAIEMALAQLIADRRPRLARSGEASRAPAAATEKG